MILKRVLTQQEIGLVRTAIFHAQDTWATKSRELSSIGGIHESARIALQDSIDAAEQLLEDMNDGQLALIIGKSLL